MDSILVTLVVRSVETNEFAVLIRERFKSAQNVVIVLHAYFAPSDEVFPFVFRRIVIGHTENFKSFVMVFVVEFLNVGKRGNAWSAPGGPEINQNNLAFQIAQLYFLAFGIFIDQVGSRFPGQHGLEGFEFFFSPGSFGLNLGSKSVIEFFHRRVVKVSLNLYKNPRSNERLAIVTNKVNARLLHTFPEGFERITQGSIVRVDFYRLMQTSYLFCERLEQAFICFLLVGRQRTGYGSMREIRAHKP